MSPASFNSGMVTQHLEKLITKQVDDHRLVVWYDPEQAYCSVVEELHLPNTEVACYDGSFLALRKKIDHLLNGEVPPRLVVYVPLEQTNTHHALIELECAGVVIQPGQHTCNTRLSVVARHALKQILNEERVKEIEGQVDAGKLSLDDLNSLAEQGHDLSTGVLKLIFGSAHAQEVALAFLHNDQYDENIQSKDAQKEIQHLLQASFAIELPASESLESWRARLGRHVLLTELLSAIPGQVPPSLLSVPVAHNKSGVDACERLARAWRNSREHRDSYVVAANRIEQELALRQFDWPAASLTHHETFLCTECALLNYVENELFQSATPELLALANYRLSRFWADMLPTIQTRWALISSAAEVLLEADRVAKEIKTTPTDILTLIQAYTDRNEPWCFLDTYHRHTESRKYSFEFTTDCEHQALEKLIVRAEQQYATVSSELAKLFVTAFSKAKHPLAGVLHQRECFERQVKPHLHEGKVAYVWVDALRFEMAREVTRLLAEHFVWEIQPAIGSIPTITEIGMAALLPKAHEPAKVVSVGNGKLALEIAGKVIKTRQDRVTFLKEHAGVSVFDAKLQDLLPKPNKRVKEGIQNHQLILITSQEIDELGETDNMAQTRLQMDGVLGQIRRGVHILADHDIKTIVLVADHGHIFAEEVGEDMKIESPGGKVEDLHRRVWIGTGGISEPSYLRTSLTSLGVDSEFDIATPWTFAIFKSKGGGRAYFHGGLSPQELIVPVVVMHPTKKPTSVKGHVEYLLKPGSTKLTTRFFSVQITGTQNKLNLFGFEPPKVRVELWANKKCVSIPVSASYGFEDATGEVKLKVSEHDNTQIEPNTVTLMLSEEISQKKVGIHLLDAVTGAELADSLAIEVAISM